MDIDVLINKYRGQERIPELILGRFKTVRGAKRVLPELLQHKDLDSLMAANGVKQIDPNFIQDGDLIEVDGYHTLIFHGSYLFGVVDSGVFDYVDFSSVISANKDLKAFRKLK